ncbi:MAG: riboflavin synthase [Parvicellaceae bacterium]
MFTGIIESLGKVVAIEKEKKNIHFTIESPISKDLKVDQSVAHNGVCLTVTEKTKSYHKVTAIDETILKTNFNDLKVGSSVNLERCLKMGARLDGHMVQGHVDDIAICEEVIEDNGSWRYTFKGNEEAKRLLVNKGSVCINGVSLTVVEANGLVFDVAIIPYTYENTTFKFIQKGQAVNIEFDIIGKYILKNFSNRL